LVTGKEEQLKSLANQRDILSEYMADISHQLKTPITSMMIMTDLLENTIPEKQAEFVRNIKLGAIWGLSQGINRPKAPLPVHFGPPQRVKI
ncbi:MAG: hypothetical protein K5891_07650, partial [Lachnospiraceae bacterium]|nr:hypothetical protein [Lachnospiraceae bacterium]